MLFRSGLGAVKGVGEAAVQSIMEERRKNGPFLGIFDFVQRVNLNACNKKNMECLALAGGFDSFPELKREQYFAVNSKGEVFLETLMRYGNAIRQIRQLLSILCSVVKTLLMLQLLKFLKV